MFSNYTVCVCVLQCLHLTETLSIYAFFDASYRHRQLLLLPEIRQQRHSPQTQTAGKWKNQTAGTIKTSGDRQEKDTAQLRYQGVERIH